MTAEEWEAEAEEKTAEEMLKDEQEYHRLLKILRKRELEAQLAALELE